MRTPGARYTYVTTKRFLSVCGIETLRALPNIEAFEDAGLLSRPTLAQAVDYEPNDLILIIAMTLTPMNRSPVDRYRAADQWMLLL
jgi:chromosome segregation and condensation protein ScpB